MNLCLIDHHCYNDPLSEVKHTNAISYFVTTSNQRPLQLTSVSELSVLGSQPALLAQGKLVTKCFISTSFLMPAPAGLDQDRDWAGGCPGVQALVTCNPSPPSAKRSLPRGQSWLIMGFELGLLFLKVQPHISLH